MLRKKLKMLSNMKRCIDMDEQIVEQPKKEETKQKIIWITQEHEGKQEDIALRRSFDGWRVVAPFKNKDGTKNWKNILIQGSWGKVVLWLMILALILMFYWVYAHDTATCRETMANFGEHCQLYQQGLLRDAQMKANGSAYVMPKLNITFTQPPIE